MDHYRNLYRERNFYPRFRPGQTCKKKTTGYYSREDLIKAQAIYHENYNAEPDVFAPVFTKEGAAYHMNYILGIIDGDSYKMNDEFPKFTREIIRSNSKTDPKRSFRSRLFVIECGNISRRKVI